MTLKTLALRALACTGSAAALLAAAPAIDAAPPADNFGTIKGRLVYGGTPPKPDDVAKDQQGKDPVCAAAGTLHYETLVIDPKTKGVQNAIAYIVRPKGSNPEAIKALLKDHPVAEIDQKNCQFIPHTTVIHKDQPILFKSSDNTGHNVHYTGFTNSKNFAVPALGKVQEKLVAEARPINLKCDIHPWMSGNIMVLDHPFFAVTKEDGSFEIHGVPAGAQNIIVWQEKAGYVTEGASKGKAVQVKAGDVVDLGDIVLDPSKVKK